ncbi:MAG: hypothetical protein IKE91_05280 [Clostridia bacterium]|nr:hypothetical protein [Clostridia bacterium]
MSKPRKPKATNSGTLEAAKNHQEAVLREDLIDAASDVTEDVAEETPKNEETKDENVDKTDDLTEEDDVHYVDLSECSGDRFTITDPMRRYSDVLFNVLPRQNRQTIFIIGSKGVGKRTVVNYLSYRIARKECPKLFQEHKTAVYMVDADEISANFEKFTSSINEVIEAAISDGVENLFLYLNHIDTVIDLFRGMYEEIIEEIDYDGLMSFKILVTLDDGKCVTEEEEHEMVHFLNDNAIIIKVYPEENPKRTMRILKPRIEEYEMTHGVKLPQNVLEVLFMIHYGRNFSDDFSYSYFLTEVDAFLSMVRVSGKSVADRSDIKKFYRRSFEIMAELSKDYNYITAIHETGHVLLALMIPKLYKLYGASILYDTQNGYEGITLVKRTQYMAYNEEDIIDLVAMLLAGRAAEIEFCAKTKETGSILYRRLPVNRGASFDVKEATDTLREWVAQNGAYKFIGYNLSCGEPEDYTNIEAVKVDIIVKWLLKRAFKRALRCIRDNRAFMTVMHKFLLHNMTATIDDIRKIARRTIK